MHARGALADNTKVSIDFVAQEVNTHNTKPRIHTNATETWINLTSDEFKAGDKARAVLVNALPNLPWPQNQGETFEVDLKVGDGFATGKVQEPVTFYSTGYGDTFHYSQSLAVVHNGTWKKDSTGGNLPIDFKNATP
jgi:hypothetical protein